jgi:hypothetical protein
MAKLPIDVTKAINNQLDKNIGIKVKEMVEREFEAIKQRMIDEFENHPVTIEIDAGENASNSSGTLGGYGNLFSFIGFQDGDDPLKEVRAKLNQTNITRLKYKNGVWNFLTNEPTKEELFALTPIPWASGRSWMDGIETGLSGLGFYLYREGKDFGASRSGPAIQLKGGKTSEKAMGGGSTGGAISMQRSRYTRTSYMSSILGNFTKSIERLRAKNLK